MTLIVNLYGGPGTGKSTTAAAVFALLKQNNVNAELVFEYAKTWAWQGRKPSKYDEFYIFGHQCQKEAVLYGKVDVLVTDRPLALSPFYARYFGLTDVARALELSIAAFEDMAKHDGHEFVHVLLKRIKPYQKAGRFQTADEAFSMDTGIAALRQFDYVTDTSKEAVTALAQWIVDKQKQQ